MAQRGSAQHRKNLQQSLLKRFGSEEALHAWRQQIGQAGGKLGGGKGGFRTNPELAAIAGKKGGLISRKSKS